uniref:AlNc14C13G1513 protein n=2 Tax=Albugo laibachii Nc14 TaxID=890382 RepID=F0W3E4_9STRA|nr:AlNc14C13G1513 [Albugo laibachii Nc14]|eukprot:CCA15587.1 AlNc14C13G1513 [Albugo laibachii Nc14]
MMIPQLFLCGTTTVEKSPYKGDMAGEKCYHTLESLKYVAMTQPHDLSSPPKAALANWSRPLVLRFDQYLMS